MNFKISCCLLVSIAWLSLPLSLSAQNLLANSTFEKVPNSKGISGLPISNLVGRWNVVSGPYGWERVSQDGQNFMSPCAPKYNPYGTSFKGLAQAVRVGKTTTGRCTLKFQYYVRHPERDVSPAFGALFRVGVYGFSGDPEAKVNLHLITSVRDVMTDELAMVDLAALGAKTSWTPYSLSVDLGKGYDYIVVVFYGHGLLGDAGVDNVALYLNSGTEPVLASIPTSVPQISEGVQAGSSTVASKPAPVSPKPAPVAVKPAPAAPRPAAALKPRPAVAKTPPKPKAPPPVSPDDVIQGPNLTRDGDFSRASLAVPPASGYYSSQLSGRWLRSSLNPWLIEEDGGNLGAYARVAAGSKQARLLYVACNQKNSKGPHRLTFDYVITDPSDLLAVTVFAMDKNLLVGTSSGQFHLDKGALPGMTELEPSTRWKNGSLSVELGNGYDYVYILFVGTGAGYTGIDNVNLSPR